MTGVFVHLPKTGGTSIREMFGAHLIDTGHRTYREIAASDSDISGLFTFAVVRNPWARMLSRYIHKTSIRHSTVAGFRHFVAGVAQEPTLRNQCADRMFAGADFDFVGRFENFVENVQSIADGLGVPVPPMVHANENRRARLERLTADQPEIELATQFRNVAGELGKYTDLYQGDWRSWYDAATHDTVEQIGRWEIDHFGYTFDDCAAVAA